MDNNVKIPLSLKVVAILFILAGISAVIEIVAALAHGRISINFGVLCLFVGPGLVALKRGWRTCALVLVWIGMIGIPVITMLMFGRSGPLDLKVFGQKVGHISLWPALVIAVVLFLLTLWQYHLTALEHANLRVRCALPWT